MTDDSRDDRLLTPFDGTLADGPDRLVFEPTETETGDPAVTYYTREPDGFGPDDYRWQPITDPAEIADISALLARGSDPPYEVWVDQTPAALDLDRLTPAEEGTAVYAWEQTGPVVGEGQLYEITDPVVLAAYEEAHPCSKGPSRSSPRPTFTTRRGRPTRRARPTPRSMTRGSRRSSPGATPGLRSSTRGVASRSGATTPAPSSAIPTAGSRCASATVPRGTSTPTRRRPARPRSRTTARTSRA